MGDVPYPDLWNIADPRITMRTAMTRLLKVIRITPTISDIFRVQLRFKDPIGSMVTSMMLPHRLFSHIYHNRPTVWKATLCPSQETLQLFWSTNKKHPQIQDHPIKNKSEWQKHAIPIAMHGDEVPVVGKGKCWCKSYLNFCWYGLLAFCTMGLTTADYVFWIWGAFDAYLESDENDDTVNEFLQVLCWSLRAMFAGKWPTCDHRDIPHL